MTRFSDSDKDREARGIRGRTTSKSGTAEPGYVLGSERESYTKSPSGEGLARQRAEVGDMQSLLQRIADQVVESDRRHSDLLTELRQRIAAISERVEGARADAPKDCSAAFSRIENRMAELKSSVEAARMEVRINAPAAPVPQILRESAVSARDKSGFVAAVAADVAAARVNSEPAPVAVLHEQLMSSASPAAFASAEADVKEPWDSDSAEALARTYADLGHRELEPRPVMEEKPAETPARALAEPEVASLPIAAGAESAPFAPVQLMAAAEAAALPLAPAPPETAAALGVDRHWLSDRFADIAEQLDRSFAKVQDSEAFSDLTGRLQSLESRIEAAIAAMPLGPQDDALRGIEQQIVSLTHQVDDTMRHVSRLELVEKSLSKLFGETGGIRDDVTGLASLVKGEVAGLERIVKEAVAQAPAETQDGRPQAGQMDQIQGLIEAYVVERRESESATVGVLQQIQGAIDRLAMRMDAVEMGLPQQAAMAEAPMLRRQPMQQMPMGMQPGMEPVTPPPVPHEEQVQAGIEADYQREADVFRKPRLGQRRASVMAPPPPESQPEPETETEQAMEAHGQPDGKQDVIAAARRAALGASQRSAEEMPMRARAAQAKSGRKSLFASEKGAPRPLLIVAAVLLLAASAGIIWGKLSDRAEPGPRAEDKVRTGELTKPEIETEAVVTKASTKAPDENSTGRLVEMKPVEPEARPKNKISTGILLDNSRTRSITQEIVDPEVPKAREVTPPATMKTAFQPQQKSPDVALEPLTEPSNKATSELPPAQIGPFSLRTAAAKGDPSAEFEVATRFAQGKGVPKDLAKAVYWYQRAASRGFAPAQYRLGAIFERGVGVPEDAQRARLWYLRSAEQGNVKAMHNLAVLLAQSTSTSPDYTTAAHWFNAAASRGLADSQFNLAILHENGLGVPKSLPLSYKWFSLAALRGDAEAAKRRDITATHLSPLEIKQGQDEIKVWRAQPADPAANDPKAAGDAWKARQETSAADLNVNTERAEFAVKRKQAPTRTPAKETEAEVAEPTEATPTDTAPPQPPATNVVRPAKRQVVKPQSPAEVERLLTQLGYDPSKLKKAPAPKPAEPVDDNATN